MIEVSKEMKYSSAINTISFDLHRRVIVGVINIDAHYS